MMGTIFDIQRFCVSAGPGIRTTVFLKGCPLQCKWCHNPESQSSRTELNFYTEKCVGCGACASACSYSALELVGREADVKTVLDEVLRDRAFYAHSGGGMTLSGGEPLAQPQFSMALLRAAKKEGLHCCVETAGFGDGTALEEMAPLVDLFLFDIKETDPERHRVLTGIDLMPYHPLGISKSEILGRRYPLEDFLSDGRPDINVRLPIDKEALSLAAEQIRRQVNVPVTVR